MESRIPPSFNPYYLETALKQNQKIELADATKKVFQSLLSGNSTKTGKRLIGGIFIHTESFNPYYLETALKPEGESFYGEGGQWQFQSLLSGNSTKTY